MIANKKGSDAFIQRIQKKIEKISDNITITKDKIISTLGFTPSKESDLLSHNTSNDSHNDIRSLISGLSDKVNDLPDTEEVLNNHNVSDTSHNDIRILITELTTRLNTLADSDDVTLDQMSELVAYIKSNNSLIKNVTTNKVNVSDIIDNLTTNVSSKPLSAKQGVVLKGLIDALNKSSVGLGNVDNTADSAKTVKHAATAGNVTGTVAVANGGTGQTTIPNTLKSYFPNSVTSGSVPLLGTGWDNNGYTSIQGLRNSMGLGNTTGALLVANGGTGATTDSAARENLGIYNLGIDFHTMVAADPSLTTWNKLFVYVWNTYMVTKNKPFEAISSWIVNNANDSAGRHTAVAAELATAYTNLIGSGFTYATVIFERVPSRGAMLVSVYPLASLPCMKCMIASGDGSFTTKTNNTNFYNSGWYIDGCQTYNATGLTSTNHNSSTSQKQVPTMSFMSYWNGAYDASNNSNLRYCNKGAFGTAATYGVVGSIASGNGNLVTSGGVYSAMSATWADKNTLTFNSTNCSEIANHMLVKLPFTNCNLYFFKARFTRKVAMTAQGTYVLGTSSSIKPNSITPLSITDGSGDGKLVGNALFNANGNITFRGTCTSTYIYVEGILYVS